VTGTLNRPWVAMPPLNRLRAAAACGAVAMGLAWSLPAQALPDAKVDQQIRPNFNLLLSPPLRHAYRPEPWRYRRGYPDYWPGRHRPFLLDSITVDCADPHNGPAPLNEALYNLADNGVLYIRSRGGVCHETLEIDHPVIIAGEGAPVFAGGPNPGPAKLAPPEGAPCIRIAPGVKGVEIRDLIIEDNQGGRSACLESLDADVAVVRTLIRYQGDASAVFVQGGKLIVNSSVIDSRSNDAAVVADGAVVDFHQVRISADVRGLDITPAPGQSRLVQVGILSQGVGLPGSTGLTVRDLRSGSGEVLLANSVLKGWLTGIYVDRGGKLDVINTRILKSRRGILSDWGVVKLHQNAIVADEFGAYFSGGRPEVMRNRFIGGGLDYDRGVEPLFEPNYHYAPLGCRFRLAPGIWCRAMFEAPRGVFDETGFDGDERYGWDADGYERGYLRDGPPLPQSYRPPPPRHWWESGSRYEDRDHDHDHDHDHDGRRDHDRDGYRGGPPAF
jgi:hypothetical protein